MILSRLFLDPRSRDVQSALADGHVLHAHVMSMWPRVEGQAPRAQLGVLHRLEPAERAGVIVLLVQSTDRPDFSALPLGFLDPRAEGDAATWKDLASVEAALVAGARFRFRLRANPTRKIDTKSGPDGKRRNGKRVPVRGEEGRVQWLGSRMATHGYKVLECDVRADGKQVGHAGAETRTHEAFVFEGTLEVVDAERARAALRTGIGPAKAYGFGLLSLAVHS